MANKVLTLEEVRAVLADKSCAGHTDAVRALLHKHGAEKLSEIDPAVYPALLQDAEALKSHCRRAGRVAVGGVAWSVKSPQCTPYSGGARASVGTAIICVSGCATRCITNALPTAAVVRQRQIGA